MGAVFRLTGNTVMPAPGVRVLRAADYARLVEANDVLAAARERAAVMAAEAEKAYAERKRAGYEDGLMEGRMEQAEKMMETAMQAVEYIEGVEAKLVGVVTSAVRKIIGELDDRECTVRVAIISSKDDVPLFFLSSFFCCFAKRFSCFFFSKSLLVNEIGFAI